MQESSFKPLTEPLPVHAAIIMDGNGRWAVARGLTRLEGHSAGREVVRKVVRLASDWGLRYLTLYVFSSENWRRPREEVEGLMWMIEQVTREDVPELHERNVRVRAIGDREALSPSLRAELEKAEHLTEDNTGLTLTLAINYGGRGEIVAALRAIAKKVSDGQLTISEIDEKVVSDHLYTASFPDPDLIIRTAGELRISNFLLWQAAYAEIYVTPTLWPDFGKDEFRCALEDFASRERRFGDISPHRGPNE